MVLAAMAFGAFLSGAAARHLATRFGGPGTVAIGLGLEVAGVLALAGILSADTPGWAIALPMVAYGLGLGLASAQLTGTVLRDVPVHLSGQGSAAQSTVRQIGAALGTAFAGAVLSAALKLSLTPALRAGGFTGAGADALAESTRLSAGTTIAQLRAQGAASPLGVKTGDAVSALAIGFTDAARVSILVSAGFLLLGMAGAMRLRHTMPTGHSRHFYVGRRSGMPTDVQMLHPFPSDPAPAAQYRQTKMGPVMCKPRNDSSTNQCRSTPSTIISLRTPPRYTTAIVPAILSSTRVQLVYACRAVGRFVDPSKKDPKSRHSQAEHLDKPTASTAKTQNSTA